MEGKVLVAYATKHGSTGEIAEAIGDELRAGGLTVDVRPVAEVKSLDGYGAAVVGSVVQVGGWQGDAIRLLKRFERELAERPVWLFSSGPTGGSKEAEAAVARVHDAPEAEPAPKKVAALAERIHARGHATFAGRVTPDMGGVFAKWIPQGDWRDFGVIRGWAQAIAIALEREPAAAPR